jgi:sugar lactone lactonase YvrE
MIPGDPPSPGKTNPAITWATPAAITNPTPLSAAQLDATANVAGTFAYTPAAGTVLPPGKQTLSTIFTPTDTAEYNTVTAMVTLVVNAAVSSCETPAPVGGPAVQPGSGTYLAVADSNNNRILIYPAPFTNDENAVVVLGQPDMTHDAVNQQCLASANSLAYPEGLSVDAAGDLYVADTGNCRVLEFEPPFTTDMSASRVIGEPNMSQGYPCNPTPSAGPNSTLAPTGVAVDSAGDLWVADGVAGRVTEYVPPLTNGMAATVAIGQTNLTNSWSCDGTEGQIPSAPTAANLCEPRSVSFDREGDLWVVDTGTQRALEYVPPFATGMDASVELGHPPGPDAFTTSINGYEPGTTNLNDPYGMTFDADGNVWFGSPTETGVNDGVQGLVEFSPLFSDGMQGQLVAPDEPYNAPPTANNVAFGWALFGDRQGNLMVADEWYNRVTVYALPLGPGMSATVVIGQPNMTSMQRNGCPGGAPTANTLCGPEGVVEF